MVLLDVGQVAHKADLPLVRLITLGPSVLANSLTLHQVVQEGQLQVVLGVVEEDVHEEAGLLDASVAAVTDCSEVFA